MNRTFSVYLDLLRFFAAVAVFVHHLSLQTGDYSWFGSYADDAVMVFFVLSGYVIAFVTDQRERTFRLYMTSRLARLYSVCIPALLVTLLLDLVGQQFDPSLYGNDSLPLIRGAISLTFTNQFWGADIRPWSNVPYWSISYEFWYYVAFAIAAFAKRKMLMFAGWAVLVGPTILLLLPVWLLGVLAYRCKPVSLRVGWVFVCIPILYLPYNALDLRTITMAFTDSFVVPITGGPFALHKSRLFLHDYIIGSMVALHFIGMRVVCEKFSFGGAGKLIRSVAAYTFSVYLLHYPVLVLLAAIGITNHVLLWLVPAVSILAVGSVTERKKSVFKRWIDTFWGRFLAPASPRAGEGTS